LNPDFEVTEKKSTAVLTVRVQGEAVVAYARTDAAQRERRATRLRGFIDGYNRVASFRMTALAGGRPGLSC
jgi:hypothetical protein